MARRKQQPRHHSQAQSRDDESGAFRSEQSDEKLYELIAAVARDVRRDEPEKLGQQQFDDNRVRVATALDAPVPPKANAIYARFNRGRKKGEQGWRPWKQIVAHALHGNHVRRVATDTRAEPAWFQDEGYLVYSLRRVADHLGIPRGEPGVPPDPYDNALRELLAADRHLRRGGLLADLLLTSGQIEAIAAEAGWAGAWKLAGYQPPATQQSTVGFDPLRVLAHYYERKPGLPRGYQTLQRHAWSMNIPLPHPNKVNFRELVERFVAERAARGLETPKKGPLPEQALSPAEIDALLEGAPRMHRRGHWLELDNVVEALAEYVDLYDGRAPLRQRHYRGVCKQYDWPAPSAITACANKHGVGTRPGESPFQSMVELGRRRAQERRREAA